ncbi:MAG: hypothetical protein WD740_03380 [Anaerolineales bacterium]
MLNRQNKSQTLTPFVEAQQKSTLDDGSTVATKTKKRGGHLNKEQATREVLNRIVQRVKKI